MSFNAKPKPVAAAVTVAHVPMVATVLPKAEAAKVAPPMAPTPVAIRAIAPATIAIVRSAFAIFALSV